MSRKKRPAQPLPLTNGNRRRDVLVEAEIARIRRLPLAQAVVAMDQLLAGMETYRDRLNDEIARLEAEGTKQ